MNFIFASAVVNSSRLLALRMNRKDDQMFESCVFQESVPRSQLANARYARQPRRVQGQPPAGSLKI